MKREELVMNMLFFRTKDIDLNVYASKELTKAFSKEAAMAVKEQLSDLPTLVDRTVETDDTEKDAEEEAKRDKADSMTEEERNNSIKEMCSKLMTELTASTTVSIDEAIEIAEAFRTVAGEKMDIFPMESVMYMYHSDNKFLEKKSKELVVINYCMYVRNIIHKHYPSYAVKYGDELYQCGCIGLINAMTNYNLQYKFNTYCTYFVLHEISCQINFHNNNTTVHFNNIQKKINKAIADIKSEGQEPTVSKIAIMTELKREVIERELDYIERTRFQYLDADEGKDRVCEYEATPEAMFAQSERDKSLLHAVQELPRIYQTVVVMKCEERTNEEIAKVLDTTIGKVKTIYQKGLQMMKRNPRLYETYSDYYSEATVHMAHYSVNAVMSAKALDEQMDDLMECIGAINSSEKGIYYVDASDPMGQLAFCL